MTENKSTYVDMNKIQESIDKLREFQDNLEKATHLVPDVKEGNMDAEDVKNDPSYKMYDAIAEMCIRILQLPTFQKGFESIGQVLGDEQTQHLVEMLAVAMTHASYTAIALYDEQLKKELNDQFNHLVYVLNNTTGSVVGLNGVIEVFKTRLDTLEKDVAELKARSSGKSLNDLLNES